MAKKKKIVFHSNHSRAFTGFGKNCKNVLRYLYETDKYEIVEFCNGMSWSTPHLKTLPWKAYGSLPDDQALLQQLNKDPQLARAAGYGANMVDQIIKQEKPDVREGFAQILEFQLMPQTNHHLTGQYLLLQCFDSSDILCFLALEFTGKK